jgi:hypothetical protein
MATESTPFHVCGIKIVATARQVAAARTVRGSLRKFLAQVDESCLLKFIVIFAKLSSTG